jgi:hypothetical protein
LNHRDGPPAVRPAASGRRSRVVGSSKGDGALYMVPSFLLGSRRYRCCPPGLSTVPSPAEGPVFDPTGMPMDSTRHHVIGTGGGETRRRQPDNRADPLPYLHGKRIRRNRICSYTSRSVIIASDLAYGVIPRLGWSGAEDSVMCHQCDFAGCINPAHMQLGTNATNRVEYLARRRNLASPLADVRGTAGRIRAVAAAI